MHGIKHKAGGKLMYTWSKRFNCHCMDALLQSITLLLEHKYKFAFFHVVIITYGVRDLLSYVLQ